ncbi:hypothetical protein [Rhizobium sp. BK491]|uniref:hypothetical protein n=1 Tax=Rhizobium sp. BK491 TaxID=2587009 RepID=UPI001613BF22|nr:hypothetical protein [Rhizobium sp. BK491]MBB3568724.1 hypothetical protein [Rhizobium sp. BK491]
MDLLAMRPSEWRTLGERLLDDRTQQDFLNSLRQFLAVMANDNGADTDKIYTTALKASKADVWNHIPASAVADTLAGAPPENATVFLGGIPYAAREQIMVNFLLRRITTSLGQPTEIADVIADKDRQPQKRVTAADLDEIMRGIEGRLSVASALKRDTLPLALAIHDSDVRSPRIDTLIEDIQKLLRHQGLLTTDELDVPRLAVNLPWLLKSGIVR